MVLRSSRFFFFTRVCLRFVLIDLCHLFWCGKDLCEFFWLTVKSPLNFQFRSGFFYAFSLSISLFFKKIFAFPINSIDNSPCARRFCFHSINWKRVMSICYNSLRILFFFSRINKINKHYRVKLFAIDLKLSAQFFEFN